MKAAVGGDVKCQSKITKHCFFYDVVRLSWGKSHINSMILNRVFSS